MALSETTTLTSPVKLGSTNVALVFGTSAPDGDESPWTDALKGSLYVQTDETDDICSVWIKVDEDGSDDDWVKMIADKDEEARTMEADWTWVTDKKIYFRDTGLYIYSPANGELRLVADTKLSIGDGTNQVEFASDGTVSLAGTARAYVKKDIPLQIGGGTADIEVWHDAPSINLDADGETWYANVLIPHDWSGSSDITLHLLVGNEIAEDDGDDISIDAIVQGFADGDAHTTGGQSVSLTLNLTGGDQGQNQINQVNGTIDYDAALYPITAGDIVTIEFTVNLGGAGECTGPLRILGQWIRYEKSSFGE